MLKSNHLFAILLTLFFGVIACQKEKKETIVEDKKDTISTTCSQKTYDSLLVIGNSKNLQYTSLWATIYEYDSTNILENKIWEAYNTNCNSCLEDLLNENNSFSSNLQSSNLLTNTIRNLIKLKYYSKYPTLRSERIHYNMNFKPFKTWEELSNFNDTTIYNIYKEDNIVPYEMSSKLYRSLWKYIGSYSTVCNHNKQENNFMDCKNDSLIIDYIKERANFINKSINYKYKRDCPEEIINSDSWEGSYYLSFNSTMDSVYYSYVIDYVNSQLYIKIEDKWYRESELRKE